MWKISSIANDCKKNFLIWKFANDLKMIEDICNTLMFLLAADNFHNFCLKNMNKKGIIA